MRGWFHCRRVMVVVPEEGVGSTGQEAALEGLVAGAVGVADHSVRVQVVLAALVSALHPAQVESEDQSEAPAGCAGRSVGVACQATLE